MKKSRRMRNYEGWLRLRNKSSKKSKVRLERLLLPQILGNPLKINPKKTNLLEKTLRVMEYLMIQTIL